MSLKRRLAMLISVVLGMVCMGNASAEPDIKASTEPDLNATVEAASVTTMAQLQTQLAAHQTVRGGFTQTRHLAMFAEPLKSQGRFLLDQQHGLVWQQETPFPVSLVLTGDKLRQTFADQPAQVITAEQNPMVFHFSHVFLSVFHGDTRALSEQFELALTPLASGWQLELTPKQAPLNAVFETIRLQGEHYIEALTLVELRGDKTEIAFHQPSAVVEGLSDAERALFAF